MSSQKHHIKTITSDKSLLYASYVIALRVAKRKNHITEEELIQSCILDIVQEILGLQAIKKLEAISLSNNTIMRKIPDMATDVEVQVIKGIKKSKCFAIQLESTDVSNHAILLCFVRYSDDKDLREELLC